MTSRRPTGPPDCRSVPTGLHHATDGVVVDDLDCRSHQRGLDGQVALIQADAASRRNSNTVLGGQVRLG